MTTSTLPELKTRSKPPLHTRATVIDLDRARVYLSGVRALAAEAAASHSPAVVLTALQVLAPQAKTVNELGVRV